MCINWWYRYQLSLSMTLWNFTSSPWIRATTWRGVPLTQGEDVKFLSCINHNTPFVFIHHINIMAGVLIACRELHWSRQKWPNWIILSGIKITSKVDELYCRGLSGLGCGLASLPSGRIWRAPPGEKSPNDVKLTIVSRHLAGPSPPPTPPPLWPSPSFFWQVRAGQIWMTFENHAWENVWEKHWRKKTHFLFVCLYMDLRDACASKMIWSSLWCAIWFMLSWCF